MCSAFFFFNDTATTEIYTLSLHDALPILTCQIPSYPRLATNPIDHIREPVQRVKPVSHYPVSGVNEVRQISIGVIAILDEVPVGISVARDAAVYIDHRTVGFPTFDNVGSISVTIILQCPDSSLIGYVCNPSKSIEEVAGPLA